MVDFDFNDDLGAGKVATQTPADIRKNAHIANGGQASFPCPKCGGSGQTRWGPCFKCEGRGTVSKGVIAAAKGKVTKQANIEAWQDAHVAEIHYINSRADRWDFMRSMQDSIREYGKLTENQLAAVQRSMAKDAAKKAEWAAQKVAAAPAVNISAVHEMFAQAERNGLTKPMFRTEHLVIKPAKRHPGVLYVTDNRVTDWSTGSKSAYVGKIADGKFQGNRAALQDTAAIIDQIAADPKGAAVAYGRATGNCGCCGRELTDPVSVANGIGPICEGKWGF